MSEIFVNRSARDPTLTLPVIVAAVVLAVDQLTKWLVTRSLGPGEPDHRVEMLGSVLAFHYVQNTGAAFGMFQGQTALLTVVALLVITGLVLSYARAKAPSLPLALGLGLLIGGATGNVVDRYRLGFVVDFLSVSIWPKFNLADAAITLGVGLIGYHLLRIEPARQDNREQRDHRPVTVDAEQ